MMPHYQVLVFVGKAFGDLMSSVSPCYRVSRILYHINCDPFLMLSNALGTTKSKDRKEVSTRALPVEQVANYFNEKVHDVSAQLMSEQEQTPITASTFDLNGLLIVFPLNSGKPSAG